MKAILHERITSESAHIHKPDGKLLMEGVMAIGCLRLKLTDTGNPNNTYTSDTSYQPGLYSVNLKDRPVFRFSSMLTMGATYEGTLITTWDADPADGDQTGAEIYFMDWLNQTDAQGNLIEKVRPTVTVESVAPLTNDSGVIVEPASVNIRKNPTTNEYVDPDITNKQITLTIPGKTFTGIEERWIEIKQGAIIRKAKTMINGVPVVEQSWNRKTILTITEDFSTYEKGIPATISIYLTETATKPVAIATLNIIDMPFKLVFFKTDQVGYPGTGTGRVGMIE